MAHNTCSLVMVSTKSNILMVSIKGIYFGTTTNEVMQQEEKKDTKLNEKFISKNYTTKPHICTVHT